MKHARALSPDPLWYKNAVFYELHVKAFYDSNQDGIGDFRGLIQKLDYLESLGVNCLWLLPFYPSPLKDDGYDISDYYNVHPMYGTLEDFKEFLKEAHARGIRVVTELVINHTSDQHPWFQRARRAAKGSPERYYYVWSDDNTRYGDARIIFTDTETSNWTWDPVAKQYFWHRFFSHQPDLNFDNPEVVQEVLKIMKFWFDMGVDGMRLDAVPYLVEREGTICENLPETHQILKKFRKWLDEHYADRMFLAESNQWPSDVIAYFGDGDECHMAFHFPLMPRIFMALSQEDRHPITDIMRQTPAIPSNCQWGIFLRNHDELTLEMVTDEERDYMYRAYASDPRMRVNIGIRRRLAPLMEHSRPRIELLNSLLFSLPGTPILYYGDEIGMGDNIYLGDRDGVRTPMQWSGDRNGGFSRADFAKLYAPPIMDPVYGFSAVNVEAQERDPSSLLNWMRRMITLRRSHPIFGRGSLEFLYPSNRKILAYIRKYEDEVVLCVANLSRRVQPVELNLKAYRGKFPVEMLSGTVFPRIGELPYFLTFSPYAFYWFQLQEKPMEGTQASALEAPADLSSLPLLSVLEDWRNLLTEDNVRKLEAQVLPSFLRNQRWFAGKEKEIRQVRLLEELELTVELPLSWIGLVEVEYASGEKEVYQVPFAIATGEGAKQLFETQPQCALARLEGPTGFGLLHDALYDDVTCKVLFYALERRRRLDGRRGRAWAVQSKAYTALRRRLSAQWGVSRPSVDQSHTSLKYGEKIALKLFRRLVEGRNPEWEMGRFLTETAGFQGYPPLAGAIEYQEEGAAEPRTLGIFQEWVRHQGSGWEIAVEEVQRYLERAAGEREESQEPQMPPRSWWETVKTPYPEPVQGRLGTALVEAETLGRVTAQFHLALAGNTENPAFAPEDISAEDLQAWRGAVESHWLKTKTVLEDAERRQEKGNGEQEILERKDVLQKRLEDVAAITRAGFKIRTHGDYHLGQVLRVEDRFVILDLEGEPDRTLAERRQKKSPLRDVAGMIRSFYYAAFAGCHKLQESRPAGEKHLFELSRRWAFWTSTAFLKGYLEEMGDLPLLPSSPWERECLLFLFLLEKVLYEWDYERGHRPSWAHIPLEGLRDLLAQIPPDFS